MKLMQSSVSWCALCALSFVGSAPIQAASGALSGNVSDERPRVIVLTDFFKDPDDKQSLIRFLTYANEFQVEGLVATSLAYGDGSVRPELIHEMIDNYGLVLPRLREHERPGFVYPSVDALKKRVKPGARVIRKLVGGDNGFPVPYPAGERDSRTCDPPEEWIGAGKDTAGSELIVHVVDQYDPRPVWVLVWGGAMDLAQALWKVRHQRSAAETAKFVAKVRLYQISWQDTGAVWLWHEFPTLFRIQSSASMRGMYMERSAGVGGEAWVNQNVRTQHGELGATYPKAGTTDGVKEGDSPSFLHLLARGLTDPDRREWGGWGCRFQRLDPDRPVYVDARDRHPASADMQREHRWTIGRWNDAIHHDFANRMDRCMQPPRAVNHHPVVILQGDQSHRVLQRVARSGERITLNADGTHDPDGNPLDYRWWQYTEAGTHQATVTIHGANTREASVSAPSVAIRSTVHLILEVTDRAEPPLTSCRRVVLSIDP
jgi:hypothetical protein